MPRYIDAEVAEANFEKIAGVGISFASIPTADVAPVVHAHWCVTDAYPHNVYCSKCLIIFAQTHWSVWEDNSLPRTYCPSCGAKMDEEVEDG